MILIIILTNTPEVAYYILSEIDYKIYSFKTSLNRMGNIEKFHEKIGLQRNWFKNIVKFIQ